MTVLKPIQQPDAPPDLNVGKIGSEQLRTGFMERGLIASSPFNLRLLLKYSSWYYGRNCWHLLVRTDHTLRVRRAYKRRDHVGSVYSCPLKGLLPVTHFHRTTVLLQQISPTMGTLWRIIRM
jgi:hypothetical protein